MKRIIAIALIICLTALVACGSAEAAGDPMLNTELGPMLKDMQRTGRDAAAAARHNLIVGVVESVDPVMNAAGEPTGQAFYTVRVHNRRGQSYLMSHVGSSVPLQPGHSVFVSQLAGHHSRGAWIVGQVQPAVPQMVDSTFLFPRDFTGQIQPATAEAQQILSIEDAFVVTSARTTFNVELRLPAVTGSHQVTLTGLDLWPGTHDIHLAAQHTHGADVHPQHLVIPADGAAITGGLGGASIEWLAQLRLMDDEGVIDSDLGSHAWTVDGKITSGSVRDDVAARTRTWTMADRLPASTVSWVASYDTRRALGKSVDIEVRLIGAFVNDDEYATPDSWAWVARAFRFTATEAGQGSGLR